MQEVKVYTDGACSGNPGKGGWAFAVIENHSVSFSKNGNADSTTNNQMELTAIIEALTYTLSTYINGVHVVVHTDSAYCMNSMTSWAHGWKKKGWRKADGKVIENLELIKSLYSLCFDSELTVSWKKVKAHQKKNSPHYDEFNEFVDELATKNLY